MKNRNQKKPTEQFENMLASLIHRFEKDLRHRSEGAVFTDDLFHSIKSRLKIKLKYIEKIGTEIQEKMIKLIWPR